ncbi:MAG: hypothetical protein ACJA1Y_000025 [Burkholderiaceae bacterium]|jgi:hypothetical protein
MRVENKQTAAIKWPMASYAPATTGLTVVRVAVNRLFAGKPTCKLANYKASFCPRYVHDGAYGQQAKQPPTQGHDQATTDKPHHTARTVATTKRWSWCVM